jgi:MFS family permease
METADVSLWILAPAAAGVGAGAFAVGQFGRRFGRWQLIRGGVLSAAVVLFLYALVDCLPVGGGAVLAVGAGLLFLLGGANAFLDVPANTLIQEETPASIRSRVYGVISTAVGLASLLPVVLAGGIADAFGVRAVMFLGGGTVLAMGFWLGVWGREKNGRD